MATLGAFWTLFFSVQLFGLNAKGSAFMARVIWNWNWVPVLGIKRLE